MQVEGEQRVKCEPAAVHGSRNRGTEWAAFSDACRVWHRPPVLGVERPCFAGLESVSRLGLSCHLFISELWAVFAAQAARLAAWAVPSVQSSFLGAR